MFVGEIKNIEWGKVFEVSLKDDFGMGRKIYLKVVLEER